jgi:hypothetical protein
MAGSFFDGRQKATPDRIAAAMPAQQRALGAFVQPFAQPFMQPIVA